MVWTVSWMQQTWLREMKHSKNKQNLFFFFFFNFKKA